MLKRFLEWIGLKEKIHNNEILPVFEEREIWWVSLGENVGHEENGKGKNIHTSALLSQARVLSSRRLLRMVDKVGSGVFVELKKALVRALFE